MQNQVCKQLLDRKTNFPSEVNEHVEWELGGGQIFSHDNHTIEWEIKGEEDTWNCVGILRQAKRWKAIRMGEV